MNTQAFVLLFVGMTVFVGLTAFGAVIWARCGRSYRTPRPVLRPRLLTANELDFFRRLQSAVPEHDVFAQVSQGALLDVSVPREHPLFWQARARFDRKIADFVVCRKSDAGVLCLVELDDRTHNFTADAQRDDVTGEAGLVTLRFWSRAKPSAADLRKAVLAVTKPNA